MDLTIAPDDISLILYALEKEYAERPSLKTENIINLLYKAQYGEKYQRISFPTGIPDIDFLLMSFMEDKKLFKICQLNKYTAELCRNELFWMNRIKQYFGVSLKGYLNEGETYKQAYRGLRKENNKDANSGSRRSAYEGKHLRIHSFHQGYIPILETFYNFKKPKIVMLLLLDAIEETLPITFMRILETNPNKDLITEQSNRRLISESASNVFLDDIDSINILKQVLALFPFNNDLLVEMVQRKEITKNSLIALSLDYIPKTPKKFRKMFKEASEKGHDRRFLNHLKIIILNIPDTVDDSSESSDSA